ncbi:hypothetical protein F2Q70_00037905 [Brassica cretica]|uniref:Uncharacterized protein n=1 Tax=Brassica cretica TaxID=69181 RepID=A0A8S9K651_BRACR|nr:hypothetical protein F2Q70_00037905 [Brassica cretica]
MNRCGLASARIGQWQIGDDDESRETFPWVIGVQEEMERLRKRVEEAEQAHVKRLTLLLDNLTSDVYNLTVQVADLEKVKGCTSAGHGFYFSIGAARSIL